MIHRRRKRAEIIIGSNISAIIVEINNKENCNNRNNIEKGLIKANYDITDLDKGKEIINEEENIKITITTIDRDKNNGSVKPIVQNQLNQIQQNVKTKKQTHQSEFTHQKMKHRQNNTSRRLRPRFRQQQKHKFLQSQRSKENSGLKKKHCERLIFTISLFCLF